MLLATTSEKPTRRTGTGYTGDWPRLSYREYGDFLRNIPCHILIFFSFCNSLFSYWQVWNVFPWRHLSNGTQLDVSIVRVGSVTIEQSWRTWRHYKHHVIIVNFRKYAKTVNWLTWRRRFFAQWFWIVNPNTFLNSAKMKNSSHTKNLDKKRVLQKSANFQSSLFLRLPIL